MFNDYFLNPYFQIINIKIKKINHYSYLFIISYIYSLNFFYIKKS